MSVSAKVYIITEVTIKIWYGGCRKRSKEILLTVRAWRERLSQCFLNLKFGEDSTYICDLTDI